MDHSPSTAHPPINSEIYATELRELLGYRRIGSSRSRMSAFIASRVGGWVCNFAFYMWERYTHTHTNLLLNIEESDFNHYSSALPQISIAPASAAKRSRNLESFLPHSRATPCALRPRVRSRRGPSPFAGFPFLSQNSRLPRLVFFTIMTTQNRADEPDRTLFVGNLESRVKEEILYELFLQVQERVRRVLWEVGVSGGRWAWLAM